MRADVVFILRYYYHYNWNVRRLRQWAMPLPPKWISRIRILGSQLAPPQKWVIICHDHCCHRWHRWWVVKSNESRSMGNYRWRWLWRGRWQWSIAFPQSLCVCVCVCLSITTFDLCLRRTDPLCMAASHFVLGYDVSDDSGQRQRWDERESMTRCCWHRRRRRRRSSSVHTHTHTDAHT